VYADDEGDVAPTFAHFGEAFSAFVRNPDAVRRQLDVIRDAGYHGIRFWDVLGYFEEAWVGKEVTPIAFTNQNGRLVSATPDYYAHLTSFLLEVDTRGLKVHHSRGDLNAWTREAKEQHMRSLAEVYWRVGPHVAALFEVINEGYQNGVKDPAEAAHLLGLFKAVHPQVLGGLSCPPYAVSGEADYRAWSQDPADVLIVHGIREGGPEALIRQIFELEQHRRTLDHPKPFWQSEPIGPGPDVAVGSEERPEVLAGMAMMALATGQAWNYMCSPCVFWKSPIEQQPAFEAVADAQTFLPPDVTRFETLAHGEHSDAVLTSANGFAAGGRVDQIISVPRRKVFAIAYGGDGELLARRPLRGTVIDPGGGDAPYAIDLRAGQRLTLRYDHARVIVADLVP
jgi:hypothetical protein